MKTVEIKFPKRDPIRLKNSPNIIILKGRKSCNGNDNECLDSNLKYFSLQYMGLLDEELGLASKKFRTTCDMIDLPLRKSLERTKLELKSNNIRTLTSYVGFSKSKNTNNKSRQVNLPQIANRLENKHNSSDTSNIRLISSQKREARLTFPRDELNESDRDSEPDVSDKNLKVIDSFKSFKESQVPILFRNIFNKKPLKSQCELVYKNRYNIKAESFEAFTESLNKTKKPSRSGLEGKKIEEHKNVHLSKYTHRIKLKSSYKEIFFKDKTLEDSNTHHFNMNSGILIFIKIIGMAEDNYDIK